MVKFGHDGWTGQLARDITVDSITSVARSAGVAMVRDHPNDARLVVGYDRRFMSDVLAAEISRDLASVGIEICLISRPVSGAVLAFTIQQVEAVGGIMVTAGTEPPEMSGLRLRSRDGGALPRLMLDQIEEIANSSIAVQPIGGASQVLRLDTTESYIASIGDFVRLKLIQGSGITSVIDAHWGVGSELVPRLTDGGGSRSVEIRSAHNPLFPELVSLSADTRNLDRLRRLVRTGDASLGLALSADASQLTLLDERGTPVSPGMLSALIAWHLLFVRKTRGTIARSLSASSAIDLVASAARVPVQELPVGYSASCEITREHLPILIADPWGGIALTDHQNEPDAIMAALLVMECLVRTDLRLSEVVEEVRGITGTRQLERSRLELTPEQAVRIQSRLEMDEWPLKIGGHRVTDMYVTDGAKFELDDNAWLLLRYDEFAAELEIVSESDSPGEAEKILSAASQMMFS